MALAAEEYEVAGWAEAVEAYFEHGWTDGLPVVPATPESIRPFLAAAGLEPDDIVLTEDTPPPSRGPSVHSSPPPASSQTTSCSRKPLAGARSALRRSRLMR